MLVSHLYPLFQSPFSCFLRPVYISFLVPCLLPPIVRLLLNLSQKSKKNIRKTITKTLPHWEIACQQSIFTPLGNSPCSRSIEHVMLTSYSGKTTISQTNTWEKKTCKNLLNCSTWTVQGRAYRGRFCLQGADPQISTGPLKYIITGHK